MAAFVAPSPAQFKAYFVRDFQYAPDDDAANMEFVMDADITRAIATAQMMFNSSLFGDSALTAFYLLAAHFLCEQVETSQDGLRSQGRLTAAGTTVGSVSQTFAIPDRISKSASLSFLLTTNYGKQYALLLAPRMIGNVQVIQGSATAA